MKGLPTASVTGQQGWEWNRRFVERRPQDDRSRSVVKGAVGPPESDRPTLLPEGCGVDPCGFEVLRTELDRKDRERQYVIDRYEQLINEKNRELTDRGSQDPAGDTEDAGGSGVLRWLAVR